MKKCLFTGVATALATPFDKNGVNTKEFSKFIQFQIDAGVNALVVCGTTGESSTMTKEEKIEAIKCAVETSAGKVPIIVGTGSNNTSIPIYVAGDANITTTVPVDLDLNAPIRLTLMGVAASGSSASVANADMYPQVNGLGTINIINRETNEQETVIADSSNYEEEEEGVAGPKGTVTGKVLRTNESGQDQAISNAAVYMIAYAGQYVDLFNSKN